MIWDVKKVPETGVISLKGSVSGLVLCRMLAMVPLVGAPCLALGLS
jgi:hypothetical protein